MQAEIHPNYQEITVKCSCGNTFDVGSTLNEDLMLDVCAKCHPFYTGQQKIVDTAGRVDRFNKKFQGMKHFSAKAKKEKSDKKETDA